MERWMLLGAQSDAGPADPWGLPHGTSSPQGPLLAVPLGRGCWKEKVLFVVTEYFLRTDLVSFSIPLKPAYSVLCDDYFHPRA